MCHCHTYSHTHTHTYNWHLAIDKYFIVSAVIILLFSPRGASFIDMKKVEKSYRNFRVLLQIKYSRNWNERYFFNSTKNQFNWTCQVRLYFFTKLLSKRITFGFCSRLHKMCLRSWSLQRNVLVFLIRKLSSLSSVWLYLRFVLESPKSHIKFIDHLVVVVVFPVSKMNKIQ